MSLRGAITPEDLRQVLSHLEERRADGVLSLINGEDSAHLTFRAGRIVSARNDRVKRHMSDFLEARGQLSRDTLLEALALQRGEGNARKLGAILIESFGVPHDVVRTAVADHLHTLVEDVLRWTGGRFLFTPSEPVEEEPLRAGAIPGPTGG